MNQQSVRRGATVRNLNGKELGKIVTAGEATFVIGTGVLSRSEYSARYTDIVEMRDGDVVLGAELEELRQRDEAEGSPYPSTGHYPSAERIFPLLRRQSGTK